MKKIVLKKVNNKYEVPKFLKLNINRTKYYFEYNDKLHDKEIVTDDKELKQISLLVEALNIKDKKKRLEFIYDRSCDLLDNDFYGKNICGFKCGKCIQNRYYNSLGGGCCCDSRNHLSMCPYLTNKGCFIRCLACKFHICALLKKKGYKYRLSDIYMLKYLLNWKQKIMVYNDFFMTKEEVLKDVYKNSIILWTLSKKRDFIKYKLDD